MIAAVRLRGEIGEVAADLAHVGGVAHAKAVEAVHGGLEAQAASGVERVAGVQHPNERAYRARGIVVLGPAEKERAPSFHVSQVHVVAEGDADDGPRAVHHEDELGLGITPDGGGMYAHAGAQADRGHGRTLGEELGIGTDPHLEILRPHVPGDEDVLDAGGLPRRLATRKELGAQLREYGSVLTEPPGPLQRKMLDGADSAFPAMQNNPIAARNSRVAMGPPPGRCARAKGTANHALTAWRSQGARSHGRDRSRWPSTLLETMSSRRPTTGAPVIAVRSSSGRAMFRSWLTVGYARVRSTASSPRTAITDGPSSAGIHARPINRAAASLGTQAAADSFGVDVIVILPG